MDIQDIKVALVNYIVSRQSNKGFILRIKDTNIKNSMSGVDQEIQDILKRFAVEADQLFYQSDNLGRHQQFALSLTEQNKAFACICADTKSNNCKCQAEYEEVTRKIKDDKLPYVLKLKKPHQSISFTDRIQGLQNSKPNEIDDITILNADGTPTDIFATSCDDMLNGITMIISSQEDIKSIYGQIHIMHSLGYTADIEYAHIPTCSSDISIKQILLDGFLLDSIINYLLLKNYETPKEIFTLPEAIEWFDLGKISSKPVEFDMDKLKYINRKHIESIDDMTVSKIFGFADTDIGKLAKLLLEEVSTINELESEIKALFSVKNCSGDHATQMHIISDIIQNAPMIAKFDEFKKYISDKTNLKGTQLLEPLQLLITGKQNKTRLSQIYPLIMPYITEIARCHK